MTPAPTVHVSGFKRDYRSLVGTSLGASSPLEGLQIRRTSHWRFRTCRFVGMGALAVL